MSRCCLLRLSILFLGILFLLPLTHAQADNPSSRYYYAIESLDTSQIIRRGITSTNGIPAGGIILAPNTNYREWLYEAATGLIGFTDFRTPSPGRRFTIPPIDLGLPLSPDTDGDGLSDDAELIVNGNPNNPYSFVEGVLDGDAVRLGLINNSGAFTGIIGSVDTSGTAVDVCAFNDIVAVANSAEGISVFNVFNRIAPLIIAQVNTPGIATAVACSDSFVAVADGAAGLAIVDISDASNSRIIHQINLGGTAQAVATAGGLAFAGTANGNLVVVDMASGFVLQQANIGEIEDLVVEGNSLFAYAGGRLVIRTNIFSTLQPAGSANSPRNINANHGRGRIFSGGGYAYLVHNRGYNIFSVTNLNQPILITNIITPQFGWKQVVFNGSGSALAVASPNQAFDGPHNVFLYDVADPGAFGEFNVEFTTPGVARAATIYNGLAYLADHLNGLQVLNYKSVDFAGSPPTISLMPSFTLTSSTNGFVEEGQIVRVTANVSDDIQVRNVEFYVDGIRAATDGNFPFEYQFVAPRRVSQASFSLQARASDTGGNFAWSDEIVIELTPDITAPSISIIFPLRNSLQTNLQNAAAVFNEPLGMQTINADAIYLVEAGTDGLLGTIDDILISNGTPLLSEDKTRLLLSFEENLSDGLYWLTVTTNVTDIVGNPLATNLLQRFRIGPCLPPPLGQVAWWSADGHSDDLKGENNGTLRNGANFTTGIVHQSFNFDGQNDYVSVPDSDLWAFGSRDFTINFWVNFRSTGSGSIGQPEAVFIGNDEGGGSRRKWFFALGGGRLNFHINGNGSVFLVRSPFSPILNQWHHLAITRSGSMYTIFVNGLPIGSQNDSRSIPNPNASLTIGQAEGFYTDARMDEIQLFHRALSHDEIEEIYQASSLGICKPPLQ